jgi:16S rRNA (cytosine967-C5)-methyltransferase
MSELASRSARSIAVEVLDRFDPRWDHAAAILDRLLDQTDQKQRATDLVLGTIRNALVIDSVITRFSGRPTKRIDRRLLNIIRIGVYELLYSPETPDYSIVNEAVNTAVNAGTRKQTGFVNAVLREIIRHIVNRDAALFESAPTRTLVHGPGTGCEFDTDVLPDPQTALAVHLSTCFSLPSWLVSEWINLFGPEAARQVCFASNRRPSVYVRVNLLRTTVSALLQRFHQSGVEAEVVRLVETPACPERSRRDIASLRVSGPHSVTGLPGFGEGLFTVQDVSASNAARALDPQPGETILDLCAAPGTKTTQLAELTQDAASIIATDIDATRLEKLRENVARLGIRGVTIMPYADVEKSVTRSFDAVLVDAPCSNTGVMARRVEVRLRITPGSIEEFAKTQHSLLDKAATLVKPTGRICYSTCSIQSAENTDLVRAFLGAHRQFELAHEGLTLPAAEGFDHDGGYVALLTRTGE